MLDVAITLVLPLLINDILFAEAAAVVVMEFDVAVAVPAVVVAVTVNVYAVPPLRPVTVNVFDDKLEDPPPDNV